VAKKLADKIMDKLLFKTNTQEALDYLISVGRGEVSREAVEKGAKLSKAGANLALKELVKSGLVERIVKGGVYLYQIDPSHPLIKQLKVLKTIIRLMPLIRKIDQDCLKIVLFGSAGRGENMPESDIDLLVVTQSKDAVKNIIAKSVIGKKIQLILKTPTEFSNLKRQDQYFYNELNSGIVLYERQD
jgi:predicted nucleotidyltransferase